MTRLVVAMESEAQSALVCEALEKNGLAPFCRCRTGAQAIRTLRKLGGGVLVCGRRLPDATVTQLTEALDGTALLLLAAKPMELELCDAPGIFRLPVPIRPAELTGSVSMLLQMDAMRAAPAPRRTPEEEALILRAKALLMEKHGLTEEAAHRFLQKKSMESCARLSDAAKDIIAALG